MADAPKPTSDLPFILLIVGVLILSWIGLPEGTPGVLEGVQASSSSSGGSSIGNANPPATTTPSGPEKPPVVRFGDVRGGASSNVGTEIIVIEADEGNTSPVILTGWYIRSAVSTEGTSIPQAVELPLMGTVNARQPLALPPGGRAIIVTGRSPIGESFRINKCIGYFEQFQNFTPALPIQCPSPREEFGGAVTPEMIRTYGDACIDTVERLPRCQIVTTPLPPSHSRACQQFLDQKIHYNGCLALHKNEPNFYQNEWRVYLNRDKPLWRDRREFLELLDPSGKVVSTASY